MSGGTLSLDELLSPQLLASVQDIPEIVPTPIAGSETPPTEVGVGVQAPPAVTAAATPPAMATLQDDELQAFVEDQRNKNTKKKTKSDLGKWYRWCQSVGENRRLDEFPHEDLDRLLGHFFMKVRKDDGTSYEPESYILSQKH